MEGRKYGQGGLIDSMEKRACNLVPSKIQTESKNSNNLCTRYSAEAAKLTKSSNVLQLV